MILKMYIADQLCYEYIFEPHFKMIRKYDFVNTINAVYIQFRQPIYVYRLSWSLFHHIMTKKSLSLCMDRPSKNHLPGFDQAVLVEIPTRRVVKCVLNHTNHCWYTDVHSFGYLYLCATIFFIQGSRSHTFAQETPINPLMLVV